MSPLLHLALAGAGFLLCSASLVLKKRAVWSRLIGTGFLLALAWGAVDPVLAVGCLAFLLAGRQPVAVRPDRVPACPGVLGRRAAPRKAS